MSNKPISKTEFITRLSEASGQPKTAVSQFLNHLFDVCSTELKTNGVVSVPNLVKLSAVAKPATEARPGINPFTKAPTTIAAKPASTRVKAAPISALKKAIGSGTA